MAEVRLGEALLGRKERDSDTLAATYKDAVVEAVARRLK